MTNLFEIIDIKDGVLSNSIASLLVDLDLELQKFNLIEDIVQINFNKNQKVVIDIGWYPEDFEIQKGSFFWVKIIENGNWDKMIYNKKCKSINELKVSIEEAIDVVCNK